MAHSISGNGDTFIIRVYDRLDANSAPEIEDEIVDKLDGVTDLTVDLQGVNYVSSLGLRLLLSLQKRMYKQGDMRVINVCDSVMELLEDTGFTQLMAISPAGSNASM